MLQTKVRLPFGLTERHVDVLQLLTQGYTYQEIADTLTLSRHTVKSHIENIYRCMDVRSNTEAIHIAMKHGLLNLESNDLGVPNGSQSEHFMQWVEELPEVKNREDFSDIIRNQRFQHAVTMPLRQYLEKPKHVTPSQILAWSAEIVADAWPTHESTISILTVLLNTKSEYWKPEESKRSWNVFNDLQSFSIKQIKERNTDLVLVTHSLSVALYKKGAVDPYREQLLALQDTQSCDSPSFREADTRRIRKYYGSPEAELAAYSRQFSDPNYVGITVAHSVTRLMNLLRTASGAESLEILYILGKVLEVLHKNGEKDLANSFNKEKISLARRTSY